MSIYVLLPLGLALVVLFVRETSVTLALPPAPLSRLDACSLPCWNNILPRHTRLNDAIEGLLADGYAFHGDYRRFRYVAYDPQDASVGCAVGLGYSSNRITNITLSECAGVQLGDFLAILGIPEAVHAPGTMLSFRGGRVLISLNNGDCDALFSPHSEVFAIYLRPAGTGTPYKYPWHGLINRHLYAVLEPEMPKCR
jgi:hypothetical protein